MSGGHAWGDDALLGRTRRGGGGGHLGLPGGGGGVHRGCRGGNGAAGVAQGLSGVHGG